MRLSTVQIQEAMKEAIDAYEYKNKKYNNTTALEGACIGLLRDFSDTIEALQKENADLIKQVEVMEGLWIAHQYDGECPQSETISSEKEDWYFVDGSEGE